jgi:KUP system potassium uptake protein
MPIPNCYRLIIRHGYTDVVITENLSRLVFTRLCAFVRKEAARAATGMAAGPREKETTAADVPGQSTPASSEDVGAPAVGPASAQIAYLESAFEKEVVYIVGKEQMRIKHNTNLLRRIALNAFLWLRENTRGKIAAMKIPVDQLVEVGFVKEV